MFFSRLFYAWNFFAFYFTSIHYKPKTNTHKMSGNRRKPVPGEIMYIALSWKSFPLSNGYILTSLFIFIFLRRPPFQLIAANLEISGDTFESYDPLTPDFVPSERYILENYFFMLHRSRQCRVYVRMLRRLF